MATRLLSESPEVDLESSVALPAVDLRPRLEGAIHHGWFATGRRTAHVALLVLMDALVAFLAALGALFLPFVLTSTAPLPLLAEIWPVAGLIALVQPVVLAGCGAYRDRWRRIGGGWITFAVLGTVLLGWIQVHLLGTEVLELFSLAPLLAYAVAAPLALLGGRVTADWLVEQAYRRGFGERRVLMVGPPKEMGHIMEILRAQSRADVQIVGRLSPASGSLNDASDLSARLDPLVQTSGASEVVIASSGLSFEAVEELMQQCIESGISVSLVPGILHRLNVDLELVQTDAGAVVRLYPRGMGIPQVVSKRGMDIVLSILGLLLLMPLLALIALAIRFDSPGPVVFRQRRTGLGGRPFWMYKFRTMVINADEVKSDLLHLNESGDPRLFKIRNDPRITRVGRFLRRTSLDELPQLLNVLRGEMSLIGPRPFFPDDLHYYARHHLERLSVLPGITGLWQVSGRSSVLDFEEVIRLDREYIRSWSIWLDLKILLMTVPAVARRDGAY